MIKTLARERKAFQAGNSICKGTEVSRKQQVALAEWQGGWCSWSGNWVWWSREPKAGKVGTEQVVNGLEYQVRVWMSP